MEKRMAGGAIGLIAARRADGHSYHAIAGELNERGYTAPRGGRWFGTSVRQTLINSANNAARKVKIPPPPVVSPDQALFDAWHANLISAGTNAAPDHDQYL
ncbi:MAG: recombinase family protein [Pseudomonadota bacterium]